MTGIGRKSKYRKKGVRPKERKKKNTRGKGEENFFFEDALRSKASTSR